MNLNFVKIIMYIVLNFLLTNLLHELIHFFALKLLGLDIYCIDAYPIKIYKSESKYKIKVDINLKEYNPGFVLPEIRIRNETDLKINKDKVIFVCLAGSFGSLAMGIIIIIIDTYYIVNLFIEIFGIMSIIIGVLTILFSDGIMVYRLYKDKVFVILTFFYYNNMLLNQKLNTNNTNYFIYKYANNVCEELNMEKKDFYIINHNKNQINLQTYIIYYALVNNYDKLNINIIKNMRSFTENISRIKNLNGSLFEYINIIIIYMVIKENKLKETKKLFNLINESSTKRSLYEKYIINRTKYFLGEISYSDVLNSIPKSLIVNYKFEKLLLEQFKNNKAY